MIGPGIIYNGNTYSLNDFDIVAATLLMIGEEYRVDRDFDRILGIERVIWNSLLVNGGVATSTTISKDLIKILDFHKKTIYFFIEKCLFDIVFNKREEI